MQRMATAMPKTVHIPIRRLKNLGLWSEEEEAEAGDMTKVTTCYRELAGMYSLGLLVL